MPVDSPLPEESSRSSWYAAVGLAAIELIPGAGGAISTLVAEQMRQVARQRDEEWLAMLAARVGALESGGVAIDYSDPEFVAAFVRLSSAASKTANETKRRVLVLATANAGPWSSTPIDERDEYVRLVEDLSPIDIGALGIAIVHEDASEPEGRPRLSFEAFAERVGGDRLRAQRIMIRLQQRGLFGTPLSGGFANIEVAPFGRGLINYLREFS